MDQVLALTVPLVATGTKVLFDGFDETDEMWSGEGDRTRLSKIAFERRFAAPPQVHVSISMIDADQSRNLRYRIETADVTASGFSVRALVWDDTRIGRMAVSWVAFGEEEKLRRKRGTRKDTGR